MSTLENGFSGVRCPECETYLEQDGKWLYCLQCGWDEEEEKQEEVLMEQVIPLLICLLRMNQLYLILVIIWEELIESF